jgi:hypothetical protein
MRARQRHKNDGPGFFAGIFFAKPLTEIQPIWFNAPLDDATALSGVAN